MVSDAAVGEEDVLDQPTRARLFARLASLDGPAGTDALAEHVGLHPSGVRVHLELLRRAGLVRRDRLPQPTGRPRHLWSIASETRSGSEPPDAYRLLAGWLARSIPASPGRLREVERAGRDLGSELRPYRGEHAAEEAMGRALTALGFAPQRHRVQAGRTMFTLGNCPYREAVRVNQPVVCALHRGITRGLLDTIDPGAELADFVPKDPDRAGCLVGIDGLAGERSSSAGDR